MLSLGGSSDAILHHRRPVGHVCVAACEHSYVYSASKIDNRSGLCFDIAASLIVNALIQLCGPQVLALEFLVLGVVPQRRVVTAVAIAVTGIKGLVFCSIGLC